MSQRAFLARDGGRGGGRGGGAPSGRQVVPALREVPAWQLTASHLLPAIEHAEASTAVALRSQRSASGPRENRLQLRRWKTRNELLRLMQMLCQLLWTSWQPLLAVVLGGSKASEQKCGVKSVSGSPRDQTKASGEVVGASGQRSDLVPVYISPWLRHH